MIFTMCIHEEMFLKTPDKSRFFFLKIWAFSKTLFAELSKVKSRLSKRKVGIFSTFLWTTDIVIIVKCSCELLE